MLAPFMGRAFHMDDPLFLWAARHIQINPANPYDFTVNWYGVEQPMSQVMENPPLASYYLALVGKTVDLTEVAAHTALLVPVLAAAYGMFLLARRFCRDPVTAVAVSVLTPAFFVSSLTVMSDALMLALWIFAVVAWLSALDRNSHALFGVASVLIVLAALTKYFGIAVIPMLAVYSAMRQRAAGRWLIWAAVPVVALAMVEILAYQMYGRGFLFGAAKYATGTTVGFGRLTPTKVAVSFAFLGGCIASVAFLAHRLWSRSQLLTAGVLILATTIVVSANDELGSRPLPESMGARVLFAAQLGLWMAAGIGVLALAVSDVRRDRSADSWLLALWVVGTFLFAGVINWTVNGRTILPVIVPAGILVVRRLERRDARHGVSDHPLLRPPLIAAAVLSMAVAWADTRFANSVRDAVTQITAEFSSVRRIWFEGHWGFQYYMEEKGAKALYLNRSAVDATSTSPWALAPGDLIVIPGTNTNITPLPPDWYTVRKSVYVPASQWIATVNVANGAGFYSDEAGALPFALGRVDPEQYILLDVRQPRPSGR